MFHRRTVKVPQSPSLDLDQNVHALPKTSPFRLLSPVTLVVVFLVALPMITFSRPTSPATGNDKVFKLMTFKELDTLTEKLLGPEEFGAGCPKSCGCPKTREDCPRHYNIQAVDESANAHLDKEAIMHYESQLEASHILAEQQCVNSKGLETGGWCLGGFGGNEGQLELADGRKIRIPKNHRAASKNIVKVLLDFFRVENVTSISDFGAGVGQYGVEFKKVMPNLLYRGYDGAGDIEAYTSGFLRWFDLIQPIQLPVTDWVMSLEVGEHIPSKYEGMVIRNMHRHNCRGIILSWGILGQPGLNHINNHGNEYLTDVFVELGYTRDSALETLLRRKEDNYPWFEKSVMVFRREDPVC